jgi:hypothetical protein
MWIKEIENLQLMGKEVMHRYKYYNLTFDTTLFIIIIYNHIKKNIRLNKIINLIFFK